MIRSITVRFYFTPDHPHHALPLDELLTAIRRQHGAGAGVTIEAVEADEL